MRNKIIWSDEAKIELFGLNSQYYVWRKRHHSSPAQHNSNGEAWWWQYHALEMFFGLLEIPVHRAQYLRLSWRYTLQQANHPQHKVKGMQEWHRDNSECSVSQQTPDLDPIGHFWRDIKMATSALHPTWQRSGKKNDSKPLNPGVQSLLPQTQKTQWRDCCQKCFDKEVSTCSEQPMSMWSFSSNFQIPFLNLCSLCYYAVLRASYSIQ